MNQRVMYSMLIGAALILILIGISFSRDITQLITAQKLKEKPYVTYQDPVEATSEPSGGSSQSGGSGGGSGGTDSQAVQEPRYCGVEDRNADECLPDSNPVCGWFNENECEGDLCVRLFANSCEACLNPDVEYWVYGDCPLH